MHSFKPDRMQSHARRRSLVRRAAFSLLEVAVGLVVCAMILVPTMVVMNDALKGEQTQRHRNELILLANGKQQEFAHLARVDFRPQRQSGTFTAEGHPQMRYEVTCSDAATDGGIPGRLLAISTNTWFDANANRIHDSDEPATQLWTAVARATR